MPIAASFDGVRTAVLIFNPAAGKHRADALAERLSGRLRPRGFDTEPRATTGPADATRIAREAAEQGVETVFALGGDGTLREAACGLIGTDVSLGFLPTGTANVMSLALGLPTGAERVAAIADRLEPVRVDVGRFGPEPFLMMASAGLDGAALEVVRPALKRRFGKLGVALAGLDAWWRYDYPPIRLEVDGKAREATLVVAANIPYYGGSFRVAPDAALDDGKLDLVLFAGRGRRAALAFVRDVARGRHLERLDTEHVTTERARIVAPDRIAAQIDGDARAARAPIEIGIMARAVTLLRLVTAP